MSLRKGQHFIIHVILHFTSMHKTILTVDAESCLLVLDDHLSFALSYTSMQSIYTLCLLHMINNITKCAILSSIMHSFWI